MTDWRDELRAFCAAHGAEAKTLSELITVLPPPTPEELAAFLKEVTPTPTPDAT